MSTRSQRQPTEHHINQVLVWTNERHTSSVRFTSLSFPTNSIMFPCSIHSETIANRCSLTVTPSSGKTFGCRRCFQATPSRQKPYNTFIHTGVAAQNRRLTLRMTSRSLVTYTRTTLMATRRPWYVPFEMSAKPPRSTSTESFEQSGICMDFGITRCLLHNLHSLLNNFSRS
jgi:hypothetical protein